MTTRWTVQVNNMANFSIQHTTVVHDNLHAEGSLLMWQFVISLYSIIPLFCVLVQMMTTTTWWTLMGTGTSEDSDVTQSSFGHRQQLDWFLIRRQPSCILQSSQDLRVLQKRPFTVIQNREPVRTSNPTGLQLWSQTSLKHIPSHPSHKHSPVASSGSCCWDWERLRPSAAAPPVPDVHDALPHEEPCSPGG